MMDVPNRNQKEFTAKVGVKEARKIKAKREKNRGIWFGLGMMGTIGWSIVIPTLIGIAVGIWLDRRLPSRISWTLTLLFVGLFIGCLNAWYWLKKEQSRIGEEQNEYPYN